MIDFTLTYCLQCGGKLATGNQVPPTLLCSPCQLTFTEGTPSPRNTGPMNWIVLFFIADPTGKSSHVVIDRDNPIGRWMN